MTDTTDRDDSALPPKLVAALLREAPLPLEAEARLVDALRGKGLLRPRRRWARFTITMQLAAAVALLVAGAWGGATWQRRGSLESQLERIDVSMSDRILLLQRAGSAYVRAAQQYSEAAAGADSVAVEVASRVLVGAAQAVAKNGLDAGLTPRLVSMMQTANQKPVIGY